MLEKNVPPFAKLSYAPAGSQLLLNTTVSSILGSAVTLTVKYSFMDIASGELTYRSRQLAPVAAGSLNQVQSVDTFAKAGYIVDLNINLLSAINLRRGDCFVAAYTQQGNSLTVSSAILQVLCSGYVTSMSPVSMLTYDYSGNGRGAPYWINLPDPGAGNDLTYVLPALARWRVISMNFDFVTGHGATGNNEQIVILFSKPGPGVPALRFISQQILVDSTGYHFNLAGGLNRSVIANPSLANYSFYEDIPLPNDFIIYESMNIQILDPLNQGDDQILNAQLYVEEFTESLNATGGTGGGGGGGGPT